MEITYPFAKVFADNTNRLNVFYYCANGRSKGAQVIANVWLIPKDAVKPTDRRKGNGRKPAAKNKERDL